VPAAVRPAGDAAGTTVAAVRFVSPTVHDVRGLPVPGVRGTSPGVSGTPAAAARFEELLRQLRATGSGHEAPARPARVAPPSRLRQPAFRPRFGLPHSSAPIARPRVARPAGAPRSAPAPTAKQALAASIRHAAVHAGVEPALSVAVARAESSLNPAARSADGRSTGTFQVLPTTAAEMRRKIAAGTVARPPGTDDVALGVGYLRYLHDLFGRDARLGRGLTTVAVEDAGERRRFAVAAFNAGEGNVAKAQARAAAAGGNPARFDDVRPFLPRITQGYVERVVGYAGGELPAATAV
jgi:soluble lytic murein transglycosylase-like protein